MADAGNTNGACAPPYVSSEFSFLSICCSAFVHVFRREQLIEEMDTHLDGTLTGISHGTQITSNKQSFLLNLVFLSLVLLALLFLLLPRQSLAFGHM